MHKYWMVHKFVGGNTPTKIHATKAEAMEEAEPVAWLYKDQNGKLKVSQIEERDEYDFPVFTHPAIREGWQLVPIEPTDEMVSAVVDAGRIDSDEIETIWSDMLQAAPKPEDV